MKINLNLLSFLGLIRTSSCILNNLNLNNLTSSKGFWINGINNNDRTGYSVSNAGDVNGDGYPDMIIGAHGYPSGANTGRAYVIYGGPSLANINLASLTSSQGFTVDGINNYDNTGVSVSSAGDINKDGYSDIIIGAHSYPSGSHIGRAYVIYGGSSLSNINLASLTSSQGFTVDGINNNDQTGVSVSSAGDVNKDGYFDIIIGAIAYPSGSGTGRAYVIYGNSSLTNINLVGLTSSQGFTVDGINNNDGTGVSVSSAGDINRDGYSDIIIGAAGYPSNSGRGRVYVIYGGQSLSNINLASLASSKGFTVDGINNNDWTGRSVSNAGDVNGDGYSDMIISADGYLSGTNTGRAYVIYGGAAFTNIDLASLASSKGFTVDGINSNDYTGWSVSSAGDINKDGYSDMIIGAWGYASGSYIGRVYVIYGSSSLSNINLASLTSSQGFTVDGINANDQVGIFVSSAGDINKDGYSDMIIGARGYPSGSYIGRAYVIYGGPSLTPTVSPLSPLTPTLSPTRNQALMPTLLPTTSPSSRILTNLNLKNLTSSQGFWINGINNNDDTGWSVSSAGDVNGDGYSDIIIGARGYPSGTNTGRAYVIYGGPSLSNINLAGLTSSQGFWVQGANNGDYTGWSVSSAGDINKDGYSDMIIGATGYPSSSSAGRAYVIYGGASLSNINLASLISSQGFTVDGINNNDRTGYSVSSAGDVNGDGYNDIIIGAHTYPSGSYIGRVYVIYGSSSLSNINLATLTSSQGFWVQGTNNGDNTGVSVSSAGDVNKDGYSDIIIGAYGYPSSSITGRVYVIYGGASLSNINLASLISSQGFTVDGINNGDGTGWSVSSACDVNKDGYSDIIIGSHGYPSSSGTGRVYVIYGSSSLSNINLATLTSSQGFTVDGINNNDWTGWSVSSAGDVNGDGYSDMIIGAVRYPSGSYIGRAYVIYGSSSLSNINLASLTSSQGFWVQGINNNDWTGLYVSSAGDVNKDGYSDMIIGAWGYPSGSYIGRAYVVYGGSSLSPTLTPMINTALAPTHNPTLSPSFAQAAPPTLSPLTQALSPTASPTLTPTHNPTTSPSSAPIVAQVLAPTLTPTASPALMSTLAPTMSTSIIPSVSPSAPTVSPTTNPATSPSQYFVITCNSGQVTCSGTLLNDHFFIKTQNNVIVTGGGGNDLFSIYKNSDSNTIIITDFSLNGEIDLIDLSDFSYSFADLSTKYSHITNDVTIFLPDGQTIILQSQSSDITRADFTGLIASSPTPSPLKSSSGGDINLIAIASSVAGAASTALLVCFSKKICFTAFDTWNPEIPGALPGFNFVNIILYPCSIMYRKSYVDETHLRLEIVSRRLKAHRSKDNDDQIPNTEVLRDDNIPIITSPTTTLLVDTIKFDNPLLNDIFSNKYSKSDAISLLRDFNQNNEISCINSDDNNNLALVPYARNDVSAAEKDRSLLDQPVVSFIISEAAKYSIYSLVDDLMRNQLREMTSKNNIITNFDAIKDCATSIIVHISHPTISCMIISLINQDITCSNNFASVFSLKAAPIMLDCYDAYKRAGNFPFVEYLIEDAKEDLISAVNGYYEDIVEYVTLIGNNEHFE